MAKKILSNNPLVKEKLDAYIPVDYRDLTMMELLKACRDEVHKGAVILTHPLSGSIKPNQTPYKSIMITSKGQGKTDQVSVELIESALATTIKLMTGRPARYLENLSNEVAYDYQVIDFTLISSALSSAGIQGPWA